MSRTIHCHHCGNHWSFEPPMGRRDECPKCRRDARVCRNCAYFDMGAHHECRESQAEWVKEKDRGNFCGYFEPSAQGSAGRQDSDARAKLADLFGDKEPAKPSGGNLSSEIEKFLKDKG